MLGLARNRRHKAHRLAAEMAVVLKTQAGLMRRLFGCGEQGFHYEAYDPDTIVRRRNRATYTEDFSNAAHTKSGVTVGTTTTSPSGATLTRLVETAVTAQHQVGQAVTVTPGTVSLSYELKDDQRTFVAVYAAAPIDQGKFFNLSTGAIMGNLTAPPAGATITDLGGGVYRCEITVTVTGSTVTPRVYLSTDGATTSYLGDVNNGLYAGALQVQQSAFTTYQKVTDWSTEFIAQGGDRVALYQDSIGTLACTTREDPVGLILDRKFLGRVSPDVKATGVVGLVGAATVATFNTSTGAGSVSRAGDLSNQSYVTITAAVSVTHKFRVAVASGGGGLSIRQSTPSGTTLASLAAGFDGVVHVAPGVANFTLTATANSTTTAFTLTACEPVPGTHATQSTGASRALLTARVNLGVLTRNLAVQASTTPTAPAAVWAYHATHGNAVTNNTAVGPDGVATATTLTFVAAGAYSIYALYSGLTVGVQYTFSIKVKLGTATNFCIAATNNIAWDTMTGEREFTAADGLSTSGWKTVSITTTAVATNVAIVLGRHSETGLTQQTTGTVFVCDHDFRTADDAAKAIPAFQYVNTSTDYDGTGFPWRFKFDGVDDFYTGTLDLSGTNKSTVVAAVTKRSDAAVGVLFELTASAGANNGAVAIYCPGSVAADSSFASRGTALSTVTATGVAAPVSYVMACQGDISADTCGAQVNNSAVFSSATDQGTGNYASASFYIGARAGTAFRLNGDVSGLTVRGAQTAPHLVTAMKRYAKTLAGVAL